MTSDHRAFPLPEAELIGGPEHRPIVLADPDPAWDGIFQEHRRRIAAALEGVACRVEHVGSTAVPDLPAKPIVDIQVSVPDAEDESSYVPALVAAGYQLRVREVGHRMLRTPALDVHIHICDVGGAWERRHLLFRDWLRRSEPDRALYADHKRELAMRSWPTMDHYAHAKTDVIAVITARAEVWARETGWTV